MAGTSRIIVYTQQEKENRQAAHTLTVDTLKTYINFSSLAFGGLLGFLATRELNEIHWTFYVSIACFFACALLSVIIINVFIVEVFDGVWNVLSAHVLWFTRFVIFLFFAGMAFGAYNIIRDKEEQKKKIENKIILPDSSRLIFYADTTKKWLADSSKCCTQKIEYCKCDPHHTCGTKCRKK